MFVTVPRARGGGRWRPRQGAGPVVVVVVGSWVVGCWLSVVGCWLVVWCVCFVVVRCIYCELCLLSCLLFWRVLLCCVFLCVVGFVLVFVTCVCYLCCFVVFVVGVGAYYRVILFLSLRAPTRVGLRTVCA